jgi:hypothetical protein
MKFSAVEGMQGRKSMSEVGGSLRELHKLLLAVLKKDRERHSGKIITPAEWFQTLLNAPEYQWMKALNSLVSDADALSELSKVSDRDLVILRHEIERLFFRDDEDVTSFNSHYRKWFTHNPDLIYSHGHLKDAISKLPAGEVPPNIGEIRRSWHKIGASRRKLLN